MEAMPWWRAVVLGMVSMAWLSSGVKAQTATPLPETPKPQQAAVPEAAAGDAVYAPLAVGPDSAKVKLETYLVVTFGPRAIVSPAFGAALRMARPPSGFPRDWRDGAEAFGRNYGEELASKVALETGRYGVGLLLHEDFRYRRSATATGVGRLLYAIGYTFVDSSDDGHRRLAVANFAGAAAGGFAAAALLPDGYNSVGDGAKDAATRFGGLAFSNVAREYSPEIFRVVRALHVPFPRLPVPEWYTKRLVVTKPGAVPVRGPAAAGAGVQEPEGEKPE